MKSYIKPVFEIAQVRVSERIAATSCVRVGSCLQGVEAECQPNWTQFNWNSSSY